MSDAPVKAEIPRDRELEQKLLQAVIADRNESPRNQQVAVGPSAIGFCRELLRAQLFEQVSTAGGMADAITGETHWAAAAHVGTVMGEALEKIFGQRLSNVVTQNRITTTFPMVGASISGALDLAFLDDDQVTDLKSTTDIGGLLYDLQKNAEMIETLLMIWRQGKLFDFSVETPDGGYELTRVLIGKFKKLQYWTQVATYVVGAVQAGILSGEASGRLVFYDRAGEFQEFVAVVISNEEIAMFFDIAQHRVIQVAQAQDLFERTGNLHLIHELRDQTPSFCFSPKVMCPLRERCWGGSEWDPVEVLESADVSGAIDRYIEGRRLKKIGEGMTNAARAELKGIEGATPDGRMVSWPGGRINVVETSKGRTAREAQPKSAVDVAQEAMARVRIETDASEGGQVYAVTPPAPTDRTSDGPHLHKTKPGTKACAEGRCNPKTIVGPLPDSPGESPVLQEAEIAEQGGEGGYPEQSVAPIPHGEPGHVPSYDCVGCFEQYESRPLGQPSPESYFDGEGGAHSFDWKGEPSDEEAPPPDEWRDPRIDAVRFVDTDPRPIETPEQVAERGRPLSGAELKAALEADTSAARLRQMQHEQETSGQVGRNRAAAKAKRDANPAS